MAGIYLGNGGLISFRRLPGRTFSTQVDTNAISTGANRLVPDFAANIFTTGDRVSIVRSSGALDFINGYTQSSASVYVNVDALGGFRLFTNWIDCINNNAATALTLVAPGSTYTITVELLGDGFRRLGQIASYTLSTNRNSADVTALGDAYTEQIGTLVSGSGTMECFWDYTTNSSEIETAMYFHQLAVRQQLGSTFQAGLALKTAESSQAGGYSANPTESLYYWIKGVVTNVAVSFEPSEPVRSTIEFVTTGLIAIRYGDIEGDLLLQETSDEILLEQSSGSLELEAL